MRLICHNSRARNYMVHGTLVPLVAIRLQLLKWLSDTAGAFQHAIFLFVPTHFDRPLCDLI